MAKARTPMTLRSIPLIWPTISAWVRVRSCQGASVITMKPRFSRPPVPAMENRLCTSPEA